MKQLTRAERIAGALYGQMLGDALGMPSELWPRERVKRYFGWIDGFLDGPQENTAACYFKAGQYTDDTAMALALADALLEAEGEVVPELIARNVIRWVDGFDAFNKNILGPSSQLALSEQKAGTPIAELENNGITNGAAMRISPLGCVLPSAPLEDFYRQVWLASSPTHKSDIAVAGAVAIARPSRGRWRGHNGPRFARRCRRWRSMPSAGRKRRSALRWRRASNWRFRWWMKPLTPSRPPNGCIS